MSRTGLYWTDERDRLNCAHGVILHGTKCINCERGDIPDTLTAHERAAGSRRFMFDTASGPDRTATGTYQRFGDTMRFTVDELKSEYVVSYKVAEAMARRAMNGDRARAEELHERINEALRRSAGGRDYYTVPPFVWPHSKGDPRPRDGHWGPRSRAPEIITDPLDQRGVNARRVGPGQ